MHEFDYGIVKNILDDSDEDLRQVQIQYGRAIYVELRTLLIVSLSAPRIHRITSLWMGIVLMPIRI